MLFYLLCTKQTAGMETSLRLAAFFRKRPTKTLPDPNVVRGCNGVPPASAQPRVLCQAVLRAVRQHGQASKTSTDKPAADGTGPDDAQL